MVETGQREADHELSIDAKLDFVLELVEYVVLSIFKNFGQQEKLGSLLDWCLLNLRFHRATRVATRKSQRARRSHLRTCCNEKRQTTSSPHISCGGSYRGAKVKSTIVSAGWRRCSSGESRRVCSKLETKSQSTQLFVLEVFA